LAAAKQAFAAEHDEVTNLGGVYVLATERHESRRIDNQLRGRAGRQGDPGASRFYLSLQDDLMRLFKADMVDAFLRRANVPDEQPIESKMVTKAIQSAQTQVEAQHFEIRKDVLKYDDVMNRQRLVIYAERRRVLEGEDIHEQVQHFLTDTVTGYVDGATAQGYPEQWDLDELWRAMKGLCPIELTLADLDTQAGGRAGVSRDLLLAELLADARAAYEAREEELGAEALRDLERRVILSVLDRKWREHLYEMDYLRDGIGLRAMAQRDPLIEYQREGFDLFNAMMESIKEETVRLLFNLEVRSEEAASSPDAIEEPLELELDAELVLEAPGLPELPDLAPRRPEHLHYTAPSESGEAEEAAPVVDAFANAGRNDPCPCGSGRKFKRCHGDPRVRV
jgi:preprotein translocase subunit SecA